jgi:hypothetical protein
VRVYLDQNQQPTQVWYGQHACWDEKVDWNKVTKVDTHPVGYSAGSHSSYTKALRFLGVSVTRFKASATRPRTMDRLGRPGPPNERQRDGAVVRLPGAWGEVGVTTIGTGPLGPTADKEAAIT